jgi:pilus assembly protein CpaB
MNWKAWAPLILASVLGLVAAKVGRDIIVRAQHAGTSAGRLVQIVAARADMDAGHLIAETDLLLTTVAAESVPRGSFRKKDEAVGRVLMLPVVKGQTILESVLAAPGSGFGPQALVPQGLRAVTIEVNEASGVAGLIAPGCSVDVVATLMDHKTSQATARIIVQNVKVLAVGQRLALPKKKEDDAQKFKSVTLLCSPRDAEAIELASLSGKPRLVLRGLLDSDPAQTNGVSLSDLIGRAPPEPPPVIVPVIIPATQPVQVRRDPIVERKAPPTRSVEVIRNGVVTRVELPAGTASPSALTGTGAEMGPAD